MNEKVKADFVYSGDLDLEHSNSAIIKFRRDFEIDNIASSDSDIYLTQGDISILNANRYVILNENLYHIKNIIMKISEGIISYVIVVISKEHEQSYIPF